MKKTKILYVEDEPFLGKIVKETLESRQFEVEMLTDGIGVLEQFIAFQPDICVLDVMLPTKDGYSVGTELRSVDAEVPIIFLTAKTQTEDVLKGFASGGNDYIRKPFSMEELIARINNLIDLKSNGVSTLKDKQAVIQLGEFEFDFRKYELRIGEEIQKLSHRETELLKILAAHKNLAVERKHILKTIWGDDSFFNSRNLDVYVTKLRSYLKKDAKVKIITLKGIGYQFIVD